MVSRFVLLPAVLALLAGPSEVIAGQPIPILGTPGTASLDDLEPELEAFYRGRPPEEGTTEEDRTRRLVSLLHFYYSSEGTPRRQVEDVLHRQLRVVRDVEAVPLLTDYPLVDQIVDQLTGAASEHDERDGWKAEFKEMVDLWRAGKKLLPRSEVEILESALKLIFITIPIKIPFLTPFVFATTARTTLGEIQNYAGGAHIPFYSDYFARPGNPVTMSDLHHYPFIVLFTQLRVLEVLRMIEETGESAFEEERAAIREQAMTALRGAYRGVVRQLAGLKQDPLGYAFRRELFKGLYIFLQSFSERIELVPFFEDLIAWGHDELEDIEHDEFVEVTEALLKHLKGRPRRTDRSRVLMRTLLTIYSNAGALPGTVIHIPHAAQMTTENVTDLDEEDFWGLRTLNRGVKWLLVRSCVFLERACRPLAAGGYYAVRALERARSTPYKRALRGLGRRGRKTQIAPPPIKSTDCKALLSKLEEPAT